MSSSPVTPNTRRLTWPRGDAELQTVGGMLAPVVFRATGHADFSPLPDAPCVIRMRLSAAIGAPAASPAADVTVAGAIR
jgi:hypothetical protein